METLLKHPGLTDIAPVNFNQNGCLVFRVDCVTKEIIPTSIYTHNYRP